MKSFYLLLVGLFASAAAVGATPSPGVQPAPQSSSTILPVETVRRPTLFTPEQVSQIESITHQYLVNHPEVLIEASEVLRKQEFEKEKARGLEGAKANINPLFGENNELVAGNPKGSITLVELFDYQCAHCKEMASTIDDLIKTYPDLRIVFKDFPIYGPASMYAVSAAYAANSQKKYYLFHNALLKSTEPLTKETILKIAKEASLDTEQLKKDIKAQEATLKNIISENFQLVKKLNLMGTPSFFLAKTDITKNSALPIEFIPGAAPKAVLIESINKIRR